MFCPNCGYPCEDSFRFCIRCGAQLPQNGSLDLPSPEPLPEPAPENLSSPQPEQEVSSMPQPEPEAVPVPPQPEPEAAPVLPQPEPEAVPAPPRAPVLPTWTPMGGRQMPLPPPPLPEIPVPTQDTPVPAAEVPAPPAKKGRLWPPLLLLAGMILLGLVVFLFTHSASAGSDTPWFQVDSQGILSFDASRYSGGSELTVPETVNGRTVTGLSEGCFMGCTNLTAIHLPDTLRQIGPYAFADCTRLRGIAIPQGVVQVGESAFSGCTRLEALTIPASVVQIGSGAFGDCPRLRYLFYEGPIAQWQLLYREPITEDTLVQAEDGTYPHSAP